MIMRQKVPLLSDVRRPKNYQQTRSKQEHLDILNAMF